MQPSEQKGFFTYRPSPVLGGSFLILRRENAGDFVPVGDYTVLDREEPSGLSEKKVMNLVSQLNGRADLIHLGDQTKSRMLFHIKPRVLEDQKAQVVFYTYDGKGVSRENAILTLEGEFDA
jgi:hypothetical protein